MGWASQEGVKGSARGQSAAPNDAKQARRGMFCVGDAMSVGFWRIEPTESTTWSTPRKWQTRKSHFEELVRRGKRLAMTPLSTVCKSSTLKESKSWVISGWKEVGKTESQVSSPMNAIYTKSSMRVLRCER